MKDFERVRKSSGIFRVQVLRKYTASPGGRERLQGPSTQDDAEITLSPSTRKWLEGQVFGNHPESRSSGHFTLKLGVSFERQKIISKMWQVQEPLEENCSRVRRTWARAPPELGPDRVGSVRVRACGGCDLWPNTHNNKLKKSLLCAGQQSF